MISVISGTNRLNSQTLNVAKTYVDILKDIQSQPVKLINLAEMPSSLLSENMYIKEKRDPWLSEIQNDFLIPSEKLFFFIPEYNGSFPGSLKLFLDAASIQDSKECFFMKKSAIVGISSGKAGNMRGTDQLTAILNYLGVLVHPKRQYLSGINEIFKANGEMIDNETLLLLQKHASLLASF